MWSKILHQPSAVCPEPPKRPSILTSSTEVCKVPRCLQSSKVLAKLMEVTVEHKGWGRWMQSTVYESFWKYVN